MELGNLAQWVGACGTVAAVVVALFKGELLRWLRHPKLAALTKAENPYCVRAPNRETVPGGEVWNGFRYWIRLWVENRGRVRADKVQVFLSDLLRQQADGSFKSVPKFTPMNLRWSYGNYQKPEIYADGISPDMGKFCDLGAISDPKTPSLNRPSVIKLAAANCAPKTHRVELHLTGQWYDDEPTMFSHGIGLYIA